MITIILAIILTGATNADTLLIVKKLYNEPTFREAVVARAKELAKQQPGVVSLNPEKRPESTPSGSSEDLGGSAPADSTTPAAGIAQETFTHALATLEQLDIPLGWQSMPKKDQWVNKIIGLLLTTFAISLGAPFWFDTLNRITKIRSAGAEPKPAMEEEKEKKPA